MNQVNQITQTQRREKTLTYALDMLERAEAILASEKTCADACNSVAAAAGNVRRALQTNTASARYGEAL